VPSNAAEQRLIVVRLWSIRGLFADRDVSFDCA